MNRSRQKILLAVCFPIVVLVALTVHKNYLFSVGKEVTLPIDGYDPRDLISGHYLIYTIDYGVEGICQDNQTRAKEAFVCLGNN